MRPAHGCRFVATLILGFGFCANAASAEAIRIRTDRSNGIGYSWYWDPALQDTYAESVRIEGVEQGFLEPGGTTKVADFLITPGPIPLQFDQIPFVIWVDATDLHAFKTTNKPGEPYSGSNNLIEYGGFRIDGFLNGNLDRQGHGDLAATIDRITRSGWYVAPPDGTRLVNLLPYGPESIRVGDVIPLTNRTSDSNRTLRVPINVTIVPEPAAALTWLAGLGLFGIGIRRRNNQRRWASIS